MKLRLKCQWGNKRLRINKIPLIKVDFSETEDNYEPASQSDRQTDTTYLSSWFRKTSRTLRVYWKTQDPCSGLCRSCVHWTSPSPGNNDIVWEERRGEVVSCSARVLSTSGWWARFDCVVCVGLGQHGAISPQTCARAPSRTENSYGYQLSCEISLKHKHSVSD